LALAAEVEALRGRVLDPKKKRRTERTYAPNPHLRLLEQNITSAKVQSRAASQRNASISSEAATLQRRISELSGMEGQSNELMAAVASAEAHLSKLLGAMQLADDAVRHPSSPLRVISPPTTPAFGKNAKRILVAAAFPVSAFILVVIVCVCCALWGFRVRSATELAYWGCGPVIASSFWPRDAEALADLVSDLAEGLQVASGKTLFVPAGIAEVALTSALADKLVRDSLWSCDVAGSGVLRGPGVLAPVFSSRQWPDGQVTLRQASRSADRVVVFVASGGHSFLEVAQISASLGYPENIGFVLCDIEAFARVLPGRVGDVEAFWRGSLARDASGGTGGGGPKQMDGNTRSRRWSLPPGVA
jgi:hypothetical protein